jgi:hypothetical protein
MIAATTGADERATVEAIVVVVRVETTFDPRYRRTRGMGNPATRRE